MCSKPKINTRFQVLSVGQRADEIRFFTPFGYAKSWLFLREPTRQKSFNVSSLLVENGMSIANYFGASMMLSMWAVKNIAANL